MQMSVRFAFKRSGEIIATPRVTYIEPGCAARGENDLSRRDHVGARALHAVAIHRGLGGAVAGRPIAIRFVDNRKLKQTENIP